jgi:hypothetical protein
VEENEAKEDARVPRILRVVQPADEAAPRAAMRRCQTCAGAHNLAIAARLASSGVLPDSTMLAASAGCGGRSTRKLASLRQSARFDPTALPMLGAGQREI